MEVEVATNGEEIVLNVFNLLMSSEHLDILHLSCNEPVEAFNDFFPELERKLVLRKVSQSLVHEPQMHIRDRVLDVEVFLQVHVVHELPRVLVEQETRH